MIAAEIRFWVLAGIVCYTYVGYPLLIALAARVRGREVRAQAQARQRRSVSIVVAAYNEQAVIGRRIEELSQRLREADCSDGELIVVSDGSTDRTGEIARQYAGPTVRVIELPRNGGKALALNAGCAAARGSIIVFADARQTWAADTLDRLLDPFDDPQVGAVSGELILQSQPGVMAGVSLYWRYEKWLRRQESLLHSQVGVTGAISAVRRELYEPLPAGIILDDVCWPLGVAMRGHRVVHQSSARAFDRLPERARDEFRRKVRTLSGSYQLASRLPAALLPWRNPIWLQFISHKLLRLLVPWLLLAMLALSAALPGPFWHAVLLAQLAGYCLGVLGLWHGVGSRFKPASAAASFLVLNSAAWLALWVWATGRSGRSWKKVSYRHPQPGREPQRQQRSRVPASPPSSR